MARVSRVLAVVRGSGREDLQDLSGDAFRGERVPQLRDAQSVVTCQGAGMWAEDANVHQLPTISHENDGLFTSVRDLGVEDDAPFVFMCECRDAFCSDYVSLTVGEFARRRRERAAILSPGHFAPRAEGNAA